MKCTCKDLPDYFLNWRYETVEMGVPARHLPACASQWQAGREPARSGEAGGQPGNRRATNPRRT
jgi:hypothetical protein